MNMIWLDLETGGTDEKIHQITQVAAIATEGPPSFEELDSFERKVALVDGHWIKEALDIQGYTPERWKDAVPVVDALQALNLWADPYCHERISKRNGRPYQVAHMGGYNIEFDGRFLRAACDRNKIWLRLTNWTGGQFDVLHAVKWWFMKKDQWLETFTLEYVCEVLGIALDAHDAKNDVAATIEIARRVMA